MSEKTTRCTHCEAEFTDEECVGVTACPSCGSKGIPCDMAEDVQVTINWHELRILGIWAENWARRNESEYPDMVEVLNTITNRLERQHPTKTPLMLFKELKELPHNVQVIQDGKIVLDHKGGNKA